MGLCGGCVSDALVLTLGSTVPRDLRIPNREANGIHFAMEFLTKNQKRLMMTTEGEAGRQARDCQPLRLSGLMGCVWLG